MSSERFSSDIAVPTLEDVANMAGVSAATVSRCLNSPGVVTDRTRDRVMRAVRELGYAPNFGARALAAKRTNTFGAIIPTMENAIFARGLQAFQEELGKHGITLLVASSSYRSDLEEEQIRALVARGADALLLIGHDRTDEAYGILERRQIPHVVAWVCDHSQSRLSIGFDNRKAMKALTCEVLKKGHRSLGLMTADRIENDRARERAEGLFSEALDLSRHGITAGVESHQYQGLLVTITTQLMKLPSGIKKGKITRLFGTSVHRRGHREQKYCQNESSHS